MAIEITLEQGHTEILQGAIRGIETETDLTALFEGECYLDGSWIEFYVDKDNDDAQRITDVRWVDDTPDTSFHGYVIDYMNNQGVSAVFSIAKGEDQSYKVWDVMRDYYQGFQEAVNNLINLEGLDFVFDNGFCYHKLFSLVVQEIVRDYLREHELADI